MSSEKATEFLLSQTREALDNALKKSLREREVLMTSRKVRSLSSTKLKKKKDFENRSRERKCRNLESSMGVFSPWYLQ